MEQNKTGKYLKYAIGEIILVVIGILIALQINNWNENRKVKIREAQIYTELKNDLLQTKSNIEETIAKHKEVLKSNQELIFHIHDKKPYSDTVYKLFTDASDDFQIIPKTSAFENLKNMGLNTLSNDSLRSAITNLFQLDLKRLENELGMKGTNFDIRNSLYPFQDKYLYADTTNPMHLGFKHTDSITVYKLKVKNYEQFLNDNDLLKILQIILFTRNLKVNEEINTIQKIDAVIKRIDKELNVNNN